MKKAYTVVIYTPQELNHSSYAQTGLFELEKLGFIEVKVSLNCFQKKGRYIVSKSMKLEQTNQDSPKTSFYKLIDNKTKESILFAFDFYDFANHFSKKALETCDFVFKRNYESKYVNCLPEEYKAKINKFGLTFGVHSENKRGSLKFYLGLVISNLNINFKFDRFLFTRLTKTIKKQKAHWDFVKTTRKMARFESYNSPEKDIILFQTRCFLSEDDEDVLSIHQQRYEIIMFLKKTFLSRFYGGFIPSKFATQNYDDALTNVPVEPEKYLDVLKKAKVVIYTRGLANSPAWKMAEYLSQGKIIIAETLTAELPIPLKHGKELLFFNSNEELKTHIDLVLSNTVLAENLSKEAKAYFDTYVHPVKNVKRVLEFMIKESL